MRKPTPDELEQLRAANPEGRPRIEYREMLIRVERGPKTRADDDQIDALDDGGEEKDERIAIAISSEAPVLRYDYWKGEFYYEVLDHSSSSVDLSYSRDGLPFIMSHRAYDGDAQHGIVEDVTVDKDRVLRGLLKMSRSVRAQEIKNDLLDGIRKKISVGYIVGDEYTETKAKEDQYPTRRYTAWMPIEASTVPVPSDYDVGIGRAKATAGHEAFSRFLQLHPVAPAAPAAAASPDHKGPQPKERSMEGANAAPGGANNNPGDTPSTVERQSGNGVTVGADRTREHREAAVRNVAAIAQQHACLERLPGWVGDITSGAKSELDVVREVNAILAERVAKPLPTVTGPVVDEKDKRRFSFARALIMNSPLEEEARGAGVKIDFGFEREMMQETMRTSQQHKGGNMVPLNLFGRAGVDSATASTGGAFKFTQPGEFIPILRNKTSVMRAGATVLPGLTGPVSFPKQIGTTTAAWSAENPGSDISLTNITNSLVTLAFKSVAAGTAFSRQMLFTAAGGNFAIEQIIENDLLTVIGLAIDLGGLNGAGSSNQPLGVLANTNIGSVTLGTNGGTISYDSIIDLETAIGDANADGSRMAYITNTKQRGRMKKLPVLGNTVSGVPIWTGTPGEMDGMVNGYRALATNQVPRNLTKGTSTTICSGVLFGAFEHLLIGLFGSGVETIVDPYSKKFQGMVEVTAWAFMDSQLRQDGAFAAIKDAL